MKMQPDRLEDLIAANALYRPGPMELIPLYCNRKHGREKVPAGASDHGPHSGRDLRHHGLSGTGHADFQPARRNRAERCVQADQGHQQKAIRHHRQISSRIYCRERWPTASAKDKAEEIFDLILKFGGYGFNKSHSTRYAIIAFQTAYMKTYHPVEYMAALLTFEMGSTDKVVEYIEECRARGITVQAPDINVSDKDFTPIYVKDTGTIRFGLMAVRGVGEKAVEAIMAERTRGGISPAFMISASGSICAKSRGARSTP